MTGLDEALPLPGDLSRVTDRAEALAVAKTQWLLVEGWVVASGGVPWVLGRFAGLWPRLILECDEDVGLALAALRLGPVAVALAAGPQRARVAALARSLGVAAYRQMD